MIIGDKKKAVSVILSKHGKDGRTAETPMAPETDQHNEYTSHAEDLIAAIKEGSVHGVAAALKSFHGLIKDEDVEQDEGV